MDDLTEQEVVFKVEQAIGSMAIDWIVVTEDQKQVMLRIVKGEESVDSLREKWLSKYSKLKG